MAKKQAKKTEESPETKDPKMPKSKDKTLKGFRVIRILDGEEASTTPLGEVDILPECHATRRDALDYLRGAIQGNMLPQDSRYGVIHVKEWGLQATIAQVTKITF